MSARDLSAPDSTEHRKHLRGRDERRHSRRTVEEAAKLINACAADLHQAAAAIKACPGTALFDRLWDRDQCLDSAISPDDPREPLRTEAHLSCGCQFQCDGYRYNRWVNPRWTVTCSEHRE